MDVMTKKQRSYCMTQIKATNTKPEILLRKLLWQSGARGYRLHSTVAGKPDVYFPTKKIAIFLDGCFWHGCPYCRLKPKSNARFWKDKLLGNRSRDRIVSAKLRRQGIVVLRFREHRFMRRPEQCINKIKAKIS